MRHVERLPSRAGALPLPPCIIAGGGMLVRLHIRHHCARAQPFLCINQSHTQSGGASLDALTRAWLAAGLGRPAWSERTRLWSTQVAAGTSTSTPSDHVLVNVASGWLCSLYAVRWPFGR